MPWRQSDQSSNHDRFVNTGLWCFVFVVVLESNLAPYIKGQSKSIIGDPF